MMILMMFCLNQPSQIQSSFLGSTLIKAFPKQEILLMLNLFLSLSMIAEKDAGNLGKRDSQLGG